MKSKHYVVDSFKKLPCFIDGKSHPGYNDVIALAEGKLFYFHRLYSFDYLFNAQKYSDYSVRIWLSKRKRKVRGENAYGKILMEIGLRTSWRNRTKLAIPGRSYGTMQPLNEITEEDLPSIKEKVVEQMI